MPSLSSPLGNNGKGFKLEQILIFASSFAMESMINPEYILPKLSLVLPLQHLRELVHEKDEIKSSLVLALVGTLPEKMWEAIYYSVKAEVKS